MRIVLISGIVFVHIPFAADTSPFNGVYGPFDWLRVFLRDSLFRVGVPCLSAISGYLLFRNGAATFDYRATVRRKARTLLVPFLLWNGAFFAFILLSQSGGIGDGYLPDLSEAGPRLLGSLLFATEDAPLDLPLYFLRDLFVCILLSPLLALLLRRWPMTTLGGLLLLAALPVSLVIVLRNSILFSFSVGIYLSLHRVDVRGLDRHAVPVASAFLVLTGLMATELYWTGPDFPAWLNVSRNLMVLVGIPGFWALSALLMRSKAGRWLAKADGPSFWIFCTHFPLLLVLWMAWNQTGGALPYPVFYVLAAVITFTTLPLTNGAVRAVAPSLHGLLTGSRARPAPAPSRRNQSQQR